MEIIKFETSTSMREQAINWWNSLTDENRKELVTEYGVMLVTGQAVQQIFEGQKVIETVPEKVYTRADVIELFDIFKTEYCSELNQDVYNQFLTNQL